MDDHRLWMREALVQARQAASLGEVPVGAVVVHDGVIVGRGCNRREVDANPLGHAELHAVRQASKYLKRWRLTGCTIYVTLEPCAMCAGALVNSRMDHLVFGAADPKGGYCGSLGDLVRDPQLNHRLTVTQGILGEECGRLIREFFVTLRGLKSETTKSGCSPEADGQGAV